MVKIYIENPLQAKLYMKNKAKLLDCFYDHERDKIIYVFNKIDTYPLYKKWLNRELK